MTRWTRETPAPGLVVHQPERGFRYAVDAFWLAGFALEPGVPNTALDLATGSGIVAFLLARQGVDVCAMDSRQEWVEGWRQSLAESSFTPVFWKLDVLDLAPTHSFDLVTCNPPWSPGGTGPVAPDPWKAAARTEGTATLSDFVRAAAGALGPDGRAAFVLPATRGLEAVDLASANGLAVVRRVRVGPLVLLDLRPGGKILEDIELDREHPRLQACFPERP
jgi:tRNA1(Val) A37 N6-methylase TrmN6